MCKECGCGKANERESQHEHSHGNDKHSHPHDHAHPHEHEAHGASRKVLSVEQKVLARNDAAAEQNRAWLAARKVTAINLISSPGSGKTMLLERTLERLKDRVPCAVITGDLQTDNDARRLAGKGAPVRQIETVSACHLDAEQVGRLLPEIVTDEIRLLFIENVGNLVCPAAFDLGENFKVALLSVTEGEDKPVKYPTLFSTAPVAVITKTDLLKHLDFNLPKCREYLQRAHPGIYTFELSAKSGQGMDAWIDYLTKLVA
jgi:hydrogenase nickel incorporation protein HypB